MKRSLDETPSFTIPHFGIDVLKLLIVQYPRVGLTCRAAAYILTRDKTEIITLMPINAGFCGGREPVTLAKLFTTFGVDMYLQNSCFRQKYCGNIAKIYREYHNGTVRTIATFISEEDIITMSTPDVKVFKLISVKVSLAGAGKYSGVKISAKFHYDNDDMWVMSLNMRNATSKFRTAEIFNDYIDQNEESVISSATLGMIGIAPDPDAVYNRDTAYHVKYTPFIDTPRFRRILNKFTC
jgi:hypothetical protein